MQYSCESVSKVSYFTLPTRGEPFHLDNAALSQIPERLRPALGSRNSLTTGDPVTLRPRGIGAHLHSVNSGALPPGHCGYGLAQQQRTKTKRADRVSGHKIAATQPYP